MLDCGLLLEAEVVFTDAHAEPGEQCFIAVHLLVPVNPLFTDYVTSYFDRPDAGYKRR